MRGVGGREWKEGCEGEGDENGRRDERRRGARMEGGMSV